MSESCAPKEIGERGKSRAALLGTTRNACGAGSALALRIPASVARAETGIGNR